MPNEAEKIFLKALLVEPDKNEAEHIQALFAQVSSPCFNVTHCLNIDDAAGRAKTEKFEVVLSSLFFPDTQGLKTIEKLVASFSDLPLVIVTSADNLEMALQGLRAGADDYLIKDQLKSGHLSKIVFYAIERSRVIRMVRESEEKYRALFENSIEGVGISQGNKIISVNRALMDIFGYHDEKDIVGKPLLDYIAPESRGFIADRIKKRETGEPLAPRYEIKIIRRDGEIRDVEVLTSEIHLKSEKFVFTTFRDVTERKLIESALKESQELLRKIFSRMLDGLLIISAESAKIMDCNPAASAIFGFSREEMVGQTTGFLHVDKAALDEFKKLRSQSVKEKGYLFLPEFNMKRKDGTVFPAEISSISIDDEAGKQIGWVSVIRDITERKKIERMKGEFISTVSHELRTPLASVKQAVYLVLSGIAGEINSQQKRYLEIGQQSVNHLTELVNNILDEAKIEAGKMVINKRMQDINDLISEIQETYELQANLKSSSIELNLAKDLPAIYFDAVRITEVMENLLSNAIKFTSDRGKITVATRYYPLDRNFIEISVKDNGEGIAREDFDKLFQEFQQLDMGTTRVASGTGLGLALCRQIVELHGGKIWVESEGRSKGAKFTFILPTHLN